MRESLADLVRRVRNEKGLSTSEVEKQSKGEISDSYVSRIENGYVKDVSPSKLQALARGLDVPEDDLFRAARGLSMDLSERYEFYAERFDAHDLSETEWQLLETYFNDQVSRFKAEKTAYRQRIMADAEKPHLAPVVARIDPGRKPEPDPTREDVQRMIDKDIPRKRKAS